MVLSYKIQLHRTSTLRTLEANYYLGLTEGFMGTKISLDIIMASFKDAYFITKRFVKRKFSHSIEKAITAFIGEKALIYFSINLRRNRKRRLRPVLFKKSRGLNTLFMISLLRMEPIILLKLLVMHLNSMHFFRHRIVIKRYLIPILFDIINNEYLTGFYYLISGKLSVGGNARKRKLDIHWGLFASSKS